ncbi:MAG: saccharopine dehydrogenase family protein, partial [Gemmatimonadota bacterium]
MRLLVLGAGLQGSACAYDLLARGDEESGIERVFLADLDVASLPPFLERFRGDPRLETAAVDASSRDAVLDLMADADGCMNALPYHFNLEIARLAVEAGVHYCDLGGNTEIVFEQLELDDAARAKNISVIPDCGLAPGMVNILAAAAVDAMDETDVVRIRVGGLPQNPKPPLGYQIVYSLHGVLDYYTTRSWVLRDGEPARVDALTGIETVEFPEPVGTLEAFHTGGGLSTLPWSYRGRVRTMEYKTLRYPGHAQTMRAIRDLGLLDLDPVTVPVAAADDDGDEAEVVPRDIFIACAEPRLRDPDGRDLVALRVEAEGARDGSPYRIVYDLVDRYDEATGISAMERATGFSLAITGRMQADGRIAAAGATTPDRCVPADDYIRELGRRGVHVRRREE